MQNFLDNFETREQSFISTFSIYMTVPLKRKFFKLIASEILQNGNMLEININNDFNSYVFDIIDTKIYKSSQITSKKTHKHICILKYKNKVLQATQLPNIFNYTDIIKLMPYNLQEK